MQRQHTQSIFCVGILSARAGWMVTSFTESVQSICLTSWPSCVGVLQHLLRSPNSIPPGAEFSFKNRRIVLRFVLQIGPYTLEAKTGGTANRCILKGLAEREGFEPSVQVLARTTV
jgi:hypothetical protein